MKILKTTGMRDVRALARRSASVDAVLAYNFRSPQELEVFLDEMDTQIDELKIPDADILADAEKAVGAMFASASILTSRKAETAAEYRVNRTGVTPTKAPTVRDTDNKVLRLGDDFNVKNTKKLESQFDLIKGLHNKLEVLDALEVTIKQTFAGERNALPGHIARTRAAVEKKLKEALAFISKAAQKKEPEQFKAAVEPTITALLERAEGMYKRPAQQKTYLFVKTDKTGTLYFVFQRYLILTNFTSSDESFTYPQYVIVFTAAVSNDRRMSMHVTTLHSERAPGTFKFGTVFDTPKAAMRELDALLDMDNAVDLMSKSKIPSDGLDKTKFSARQYIQDVSVTDDQHVRIKMSKKLPVDAAKRQLVVQKAFLDLKTLLGYGRTQTLKYKLLPQADKTLVMDFVLVPQSSGRQKHVLDDRKRRILETHFGFDDGDIDTLIRVMQRGF